MQMALWTCTGGSRRVSPARGGGAGALRACRFMEGIHSHDKLVVYTFLWQAAVSGPLKEDSFEITHQFEQAVQGHSKLPMGQRV